MSFSSTSYCELSSTYNRSEAVVQSTNVAVEANGEEEIIEVKNIYHPDDHDDPHDPDEHDFDNFDKFQNCYKCDNCDNYDNYDK